MIFKVAICDDDKEDIQILERFLQKIGAQLDIDFEISSFNDSRELLTCYSRPGAFDILFLDVEMPEPSGMELARKIRSLPDRDTRIVFVSSYPQYMRDSFNVQAFQYLTKPYSYEEFKKIILQITKDYDESRTTRLLVKTDYSEELVNIYNIISIECSNAKKKIIHVQLEDYTVEAVGTIGELEKELEEYGFVSPCRGFLINIRHLHYFKNNEIVMSNGSIIPLSRRREKTIRNMFNKKILVLSRKR